MQLDLKRLSEELTHYPVGHTIDYHYSLPSTMPVAHQLAAQPTVRSGTLVVAEEQSAGRGRLQRRWEAPFGQALLVSVICKPPILGSPLLLSIVAGLATVHAFEAFVPSLAGQVGLKWPNDVLLGPNRPGEPMLNVGKVAGVLVEGVFQQNELIDAVLGIGINVNQESDALPPALPGAPAPTSLRHYLGHTLDRTALLIALCQSLSHFLSASLPAQALHAAWRSRLWTLGQWVSIHPSADNGEIFSGRAIDVTAEGHLVVEDETGIKHVFATGDVSVRTF